MLPSQPYGLQLLNGRKRNGNGPEDLEARTPAHREDRSKLDTTILFVDDDPGVLTTRQLLFEHLGYNVLTAGSGEGALAILDGEPVDAVVLDYVMPGMDGEQTARAIRKMRPDLPIISSSGVLSLPPAMMKLVDAAVEKAIDPCVLIDVLQQLCVTPNKALRVI